jgi:hypothetical protein
LGGAIAGVRVLGHVRDTFQLHPQGAK